MTKALTKFSKKHYEAAADFIKDGVAPQDVRLIANYFKMMFERDSASFNPSRCYKRAGIPYDT